MKVCVDHNQPSLATNPLNSFDIFMAGCHIKCCLTYFEFYIIFFTQTTIRYPDVTLLLECRELECLGIDARCMLEQFTGTALSEIANAWPGLHSLTLNLYPQKQPMLCTICCLQQLTQSCPALEDITINFSLLQHQFIPEAWPGNQYGDSQEAFG